MTCTTNISIKIESLQNCDSTHDLVDVISGSEANSKITTNKIYSEIAKSSKKFNVLTLYALSNNIFINCKNAAQRFAVKRKCN